MNEQEQWDDRVFFWAFMRPWWLRILMAPVMIPFIFFRAWKHRVRDEFRD